MYGLAITLGIVALVAAILGFGGIAGAFADLAIIVFVFALVLSIVFLVLGWKAAKKIIG